MALDLRSWSMANQTTGEVITGQFEAENVVEGVSATWGSEAALNRETPVRQFLHGNSTTLSFQARLFARDSVFNTVKEDLDKIKEWCNKRNLNTGRPPVVTFWAGNGDLLIEATINSISNITYDTLTALGTLRGCSMTIELEQFTPFTLESGPAPETRYAYAKEREYPELMAAREYGDPMLGVIIRQRHPQRPLTQTGDTVKLPSLDAIKNLPRAPSSLALAGVTSRVDSPQKANRDATFERLNARRHWSAVILEG